MENIIGYLNIVSIGILCISVLILIVRVIKKSANPLFIFALLALLGASLTNVVEHFGISTEIDNLEDVVKILFIPLLIFSIHSSIIQNELVKRKISEKKFKAIFNQAFTFIGLLDEDGRLIEANDTALNFAGENFGKLKDVPFKDCPWWNHNNKEQQKIIDAITLVKNGKTIRFETTHCDLNGKNHFIDFTLKPLFNDKNELIYMIPEGRDITELKSAKLELERHKNNLELLVKERTEELEVMNEEMTAINEELYDKNNSMAKSNKELSESKAALEQTLLKLQETQDQLIQSEKLASLGILTAGIAHEINNPINFINSGIIGLKKSVARIENICIEYRNALEEEKSNQLIEAFNCIDDKLNKKSNLEAIKVLVANIETGIERTVEIVSSLKFFMRTDKDMPSSVNLHDIINSVLIILYSEYKNNITITKNFQMQKHIKCTPGKINQVIMNVIINAIQSIEGKGEIIITTRENEAFAEIIIADNGCGISPEIESKIYDPFFTTKPVGKGTGLGLAISYKIIEEHKGQLSFKNNENSGTTFTIALPII